MPRRSDHKDFAAGGDDDYSNAFIEGVINTAPTRGSEMGTKKRSENQAAHDEWAANVYSKYDPDDYGDKKKNQCTCASAWVAIMSVLLLLIGVGMFALGIVEQHHTQILPLCPGCKLFITGLYLAGAALLVIAILGFMSAKTKFGCLSIPFAFLMLAMGIAFFAIGIIAILYGTGAKKLDIEKLWQNAVKDDPHFVCSIQSDLHCSGYGQYCCFSEYAVNTSLTAAPGTPVSPAASTVSVSGGSSEIVSDNSGSVAASTAQPVNTTPGYCWTLTADGHVPDPVLTHCSDYCEMSNGYSVTCDSALQKKIKEYLLPVVGTTFPLAVLMVLTGIASIKMVCCKPKGSED